MKMEAQIQSYDAEITVSKINSIDKIDSIKKDWNLLHKSYNSNNLYTDPDYFETMFKSRVPADAQINVVLFKRKQNPIAIIIGWTNPNYIVTSWFGYCKLNSLSLKCFEVENNGIITDGEKETEQFVFHYLKNLIKKREVELFSLNHLTSKNPLWSKLLSGKGMRKRSIYKNSVNWITTLRNSNTGERNHIHCRKTLLKLSRKAKKFNNSFDNEINIRVFNLENEVSSFIKYAETISKNSYQYSINVGVSDNQYWHEMLMALAKGKYLRAYMLFVKNKPVAYIFGMQYSNILFLVATAFDYNYEHYSPGEYLRHALIDEFLELGIDVIDYGYGDAIYKQRCGTEFIEEASIRIYGNGLKAYYSSIVDKFITQISSKFLEVLKEIDLLDRIKIIWRKKLIKKTAVF